MIHHLFGVFESAYFLEEMLYQQDYLQIVILNLLQLRHSFLTITAQNAHPLEIHICHRNYFENNLVLNNFIIANNYKRFSIHLRIQDQH